MKSNNNSANTHVEESWASTISDYILQRRAQTYSAYVQTDTDSLASFMETDSYLFKALFVVLAKQLEEGHTVLTLRQSDSEIPLQGRVRDRSATLYSWQRDVLQSLAAPLFDLMDSSLVATVFAQEKSDIDSLLEAENSDPIFNLLHILMTRGTQLWLQSSLSNSNKEQLVERFKLVKQLYNLMQ